MKDNHWYKSAKTGVFLHWGIKNGNTAVEFERRTEGWDAREWIKAAKKLRASYVTLATFHSDLSWIIPWRSKISGLNKTKRDFLGELIAEAEKEGIRVIAYITSSPTDDKGINASNCIDHAEYKKYKGDMSLKTESSFIDFQSVLAKEVVMELMDNYPSIAGFWFDGWNDYYVCTDIFKAVHDKNPDCINIRNNFYKEPYPDEDVMAQECLGKIHNPSYDMASASWLEDNIASEWCYVPFGEWFVAGVNKIAPCQISEQIKIAVSIMSSGWVAKVGLPPYENGTFAPFVHEYLGAMDEFFNWSSEAFFGTTSGGFIGGNWNDRAYGFTTKSKDAYYISVTDAPVHRGRLTLINNGFEIFEVINLKTGEKADFSFDNNTISINCSDWGEVSKSGVMIFKILAERAGEISEIKIEKSQNEPLPSSIIFETDENLNYAGLEITEHNTSSVTRGSWGGQSPQRLKKYALYDENTGKKIKEGYFLNQRGAKWISLDGINAKKLRLEFLETYDSGKKSAAACWAGGWQQYIDDVISISSNEDNVIQYVNGLGELWEKNGCNNVKLRDNINKVVCGNDGKFYYIDVNNTVIGGKSEIKAMDLAVSSEGGLYYIGLDGCLKKEGNSSVILDNADNISLDSEDTLYIAAKTAYRYKDGSLEQYKIPYNAVKIAPGNAQGYIAIATPSGKVHFANKKGDNSFIGGYDCRDLNCGKSGVLWAIFGGGTGAMNVKSITLVASI